MKKRILLFTLAAGFGYVTLTSNAGGAAMGSGGNRTGVNGSPTSCGNTGGTCHGTAAGATVAITVDSGTTSVATTHYKPGKSYTIKIHGTNTLSYTKFGFEFAAVSGTSPSQVQAGTYPAMTSPIFADAVGGITYIEQGSAISSPAAGLHDVSFVWNAPATNVGNVTLYCTLNAVNGDGSDNTVDRSANVQVVLTPISTTDVPEVVNNLSVATFPNPVVNTLNLQLDNAQPGNYNVHIFNLNGSVIASQNIAVIGAAGTAAINTSNWATGLYNVVVENETGNKTILVVKQ